VKLFDWKYNSYWVSLRHLLGAQTHKGRNEGGFNCDP